MKPLKSITVLTCTNSLTMSWDFCSVFFFFSFPFLFLEYTREVDFIPFLLSHANLRQYFFRCKHNNIWLSFTEWNDFQWVLTRATYKRHCRKKNKSINSTWNMSRACSCSALTEKKCKQLSDMIILCCTTFQLHCTRLSYSN